VITRDTFDLEIVKPNYRFVLYRCGVLMHWHDDHHDVAQETFLDLWVTLQREQIDNIRGWLVTASKFNVFSWWRRTMPLQIDETVSEFIHNQPAPSDPYEDVLQSELTGLLFEVTSTVAEMYRRPFLARYIDGKTLAQIAEENGCELQAVAKRIKLAFKFARYQVRRAVGLPAVLPLKAMTVHCGRTRNRREAIA
jgi:RNA polymerase sigma factor (sigma-70 family)